MKYLKTFESFELLKEDGGGLIGMAVGFGIPAVLLTTAYIYAVKKYKKENPTKSWKESFLVIRDSMAAQAHSDRAIIG